MYGWSFLRPAIFFYIICEKSWEKIWQCEIVCILLIYQFNQTIQLNHMKKYIVHTESSWSFAIAASNYSEAIKTGRRICRHTGEKFRTVRIVK